MAVEVIYRVINRHGDIVEETVDKKTADLIDQRLDAIYEICDFLMTSRSPLQGLVKEQDVEKLAEHLVDNRDFVTGILKKVKDLPPAKTPREAGTPRKPADKDASDQAA